MKYKRKPRATALNEVTATIMLQNQNMNFHQTFMMDTTENHSFTFRGKQYNIPADHAVHYSPSFWAFDKKLAMFYEQHKTIARFFDWFHFRDKASYEIGYLYYEDNEDPTSIDAPERDWALENFNLRNNSTVEGQYKESDEILKGETNNFSRLGLILALIIGIVAVVVVLGFMFGNPVQTQPIQNITATNVTTPIQTAIPLGMVKLP